MVRDGIRDNWELEEIDVEERLDEMIRSGVWNWRNEVCERNSPVSYDETDFDAEQNMREARYLLRKDGWGYYE